MSTERDDRADLTTLNHHFIRSVQESDVAWFDAHLSADFLNTTPDGKLLERDAFLKHISGDPGITGLHTEDVRIRLFGDSAIIHARTVYTKGDGSPGVGRYTDTWHREGGANGRWLCTTAQVARG